MSATEQKSSQTANAEAIEAWDGPLFERFVSYRHIVVTALTAYGDEALRLHPPREGDRVLDVGCGFGDTTRQLAELVGPTGSALGVDASPRFIEAARSESEGVANVELEVADVEARVHAGHDRELAAGADVEVRGRQRGGEGLVVGHQSIDRVHARDPSCASGRPAARLRSRARPGTTRL